MSKKINIFIIGFFSILTIYTKIGFALYIPILFYYLIRNVKNIYIYAPSGILGIIFSGFMNDKFIENLRSHLIPYLLLLVVVLFVLWIMDKINKSWYIYLFVLLLNVFSNFILFKSVDSYLLVVMLNVLSLILYAFLERNLIESFSKNNYFYNFAYLEIIIALVAVLGASEFYIYSLNLGLLLSIYFVMYFSNTYKNLYSILYSLLNIFILIYFYNVTDALILIIVVPFYFLKSVYPMMFINIFATILVFGNVYFNNYLILSLMAISVLFELFKIFIVKNASNEDISIDKIQNQITNNISNEVLGFAGFLDMFVENFKEPNDYTTLLHEGVMTLQNNCCGKCPLKKDCFNYYKNNLYIYLKVILLNESISSNEYQYFLKNCLKINIMKNEALRLNQRYNYQDIPKTNSSLIVQLVGVSNAIRKYAIDLIARSEISKSTLLQLKEHIINYGYEITYFEVIKPYEDDYLIEIGINTNEQEDLIKNIRKIANNTLFKKTSVLFEKEVSNIKYFKIIPQVRIEITYGFGSMSKDDNICGDNYLIKDLNNGKFVSAISDGMGSGYVAFHESNQTLKLIEKIIDQNLDSQTALEILNTFYAIQKYMEKYSTLDFLEINRYQMKARFYKMGATTSYIIKHNGTIEKIVNKNLPFGIEDYIDNKEIYLEDDDLILMSSDGIFENIENNEDLDIYIKKIRGETPQKIVYDLLNYTINNDIKTNDDATLIALKIKYIN